MTNKTAKQIAIEHFNVIKIFCGTTEASGYTAKELKMLSLEFREIVKECDYAIAELSKCEDKILTTTRK